MSEYKLVPVEPTREMIDACRWPFSLITPLIEGYQAMLAAAPSPEWVKTNDRLPTREDADESGKVWIFSDTLVYPLSFDWVYQAGVRYWMPKPRVQPPEPPEET